MEKACPGVHGVVPAAIANDAASSVRGCALPGRARDDVPLENRILAVTWAFMVFRRPVRTR
jgi:hypothetical protein